MERGSQLSDTAINEARGNGDLETQLERLAEVWDWYRTNGPGKDLTTEEADVVFRHARFTTVSQGWGVGQDRLETEKIEQLVGFSYTEYWDKLKELDVDKKKEAGLERRSFYLVDVAKGRKKMPSKKGK